MYHRLFGLIFVLTACAAKPTEYRSEPRLDTNACFLRALNYCSELGAGCIDARMRACDNELARNSPVMTEGLRSTLVSCFETELFQQTEPTSSDIWRRCLHLLEAEQQPQHPLPTGSSIKSTL